jgi:hypothetical protein
VRGKERERVRVGEREREGGRGFLNVFMFVCDFALPLFLLKMVLGFCRFVKKKCYRVLSLMSEKAVLGLCLFLKIGHWWQHSGRTLATSFRG